MNKFGAKKTVVDGILFDSKSEAKYFRELVLLKHGGIVTEIELQPAFVIVDAYRHPVTRKIVRCSKYVADFRVTYASGHVEVVDVKTKATRTSTYLLKKKLFESRYGIGIVEIER